MIVVLVACTVFLILGFANKARCLNGQFNARAFHGACYNDLQPLFGVRLFADLNGDGTAERVFPYVDGFLDEGTNELRDGAIEYPVLTGFFMWASSLPVTDGEDYLRISAVLLAPFGLIVAYHLARMAGWRALLWAAAPALIFYSFHNWDLLVVAAAVAGIYMWWRGKPLWAAVLFGVGAGLKMYPLFFLGPLFLDRLARKDVRGAFTSAGVGVATVTAINLPFALANLDGWLATYTFHSHRGPNFDSVWCAMRDMCLGTNNWDPSQLNLITAGLTAAFFLAVLCASWIVYRREGVYPFVQTCGALLASFLLFNKVHSPQYTLWLLPFLVLIGRHVYAIAAWVLYSVADAYVYWGIFRWFTEYNTTDFPISEKVMLIGIWMRAALLLGLVVMFMLARDTDVPGAEPAGVRDPSHPPPLEPAVATHA